MEKARIQARLNTLDEKIEEVKQRMPAHSVKPSIMSELLELEDEKELLTRKLHQAAK